MHWLFKEEPSHYSFDALVADGGTSWSGVKNPQAQKNLRSVKKGDVILYYHTGDEKAVVGAGPRESQRLSGPGGCRGARCTWWTSSRSAGSSGR